jgi:hypothetical protein
MFEIIIIFYILPTLTLWAILAYLLITEHHREYYRKLGLTYGDICLIIGLSMLPGVNISILVDSFIEYIQGKLGTWWNKKI